MEAVPLVADTPTEANIDSLRRTLVWPWGQVTLLSASPIARRSSKETPQSRHAYS
jgi:hypothetical protein